VVCFEYFLSVALDEKMDSLDPFAVKNKPQAASSHAPYDDFFILFLSEAV
jgi:hypothetical protein